jgi:linear primary-alkylsulfatase
MAPSFCKFGFSILPKFAALLLISASVSAAKGGGEIKYADPDKHFDPLGKPPSEYTLKAIAEDAAGLPFDDTRDFAEAGKGFIAAPDSWIVKGPAGNTVWDLERYKFFLRDTNFPSVHPSLQRISRLNMKVGLYKVKEGFYQVRGYDLANITFVATKSGWIVFDPLTAPEPAAMAKKLVDKHLGERPILGVVYSHSHVDHWGGVRGIVDEADVRSGKVQIIAPRDFMNHAVSENVFAGNAMNRRVQYQYGTQLPASPFGHAGQGLNMNVAQGNIGLIAPTIVIEEDIEVHTIDGLKMEFMNTPGAEAPSQAHTWFPDHNVYWTGEDVTGVFHNVYTLRGAPVRNPHAWSQHINRALYRYGKRAETMIASHHWPRWGNERVQEVLRGQRDLYANINNYVLFHANQGVTINQIHNVYETPEGIARSWFNRGYHGSPEHNSRAVINRFLGYWDGNPATLIPLSPADSAPLYVKMMGGSSKILKEGQKLHDAGDYRLAQEILNKLVQAKPDNRKARLLLADVWEQIGYQQENPGLRNSFLQGAYELRNGLPGAPPNSAGPDVVRAMTTGQFLDFLGVRMDASKAGDLTFIANLVTPDNGEKYVVELSNSTLTNIEGFQADEPDLTITIDRTDLEAVMMGQIRLKTQIEKGVAKATGDVSLLDKLAATFATFSPDFPMIPGTTEPPPEGEWNPYEAGVEMTLGE